MEVTILMSPVHDVIGVIGGSGLYELLDDSTSREMSTPFGPPSGPVTIGTVGDRQVAFIARHGPGHQYQPHRIPYRANLWALHELGVRRVLAPCAVGSLDAAYGPGTLVVPDQLVDRTSGRVKTFFDQDGGVHAPFADPYCPDLRKRVAAHAESVGWPPLTDATLVVIEGPAFSTRAESRWYAAQGWRIVGMTGVPEAVLARELGMCYVPVALVTDLDAGAAEGQGVSHQDVLAIFEQNIGRLRELLMGVLAELPSDSSCGCAELVADFPATPTLPA